MKIKTASILAGAVATAVLAFPVPAVFAQRPVGTFGPSTPQRNVNPTPSAVILPMGNPVAPMGNPVQPIIPSPFIRYSGPTPTVVIPEQSRGNRGDNGRDRGRDNGRDNNNRQGQRGR